jgi:hypothetical protein
VSPRVQYYQRGLWLLLHGRCGSAEQAWPGTGPPPFPALFEARVAFVRVRTVFFRGPLHTRTLFVCGCFGHRVSGQLFGQQPAHCATPMPAAPLALLQGVLGCSQASCPSGLVPSRLQHMQCLTSLTKMGWCPHGWLRGLGVCAEQPACVCGVSVCVLTLSVCGLSQGAAYITQAPGVGKTPAVLLERGAQGPACACDQGLSTRQGFVLAS